MKADTDVQTSKTTTKPPASVRLNDWFGELVLAVDVFAACIETGVLPTHGSPCHRMARRIVKDSGIPPKRKRRRLPMSTTTPTFPRSSIPQWEAKHEHNHAGDTMTARRDLEHNLPLLRRALAVQSAGGSLSDFARQMGVSKSAIYVAINKARKTGRLK